jgi:hypothetical protein
MRRTLTAKEWHDKFGADWPIIGGTVDFGGRRWLVVSIKDDEMDGQTRIVLEA